jgi:hypothetical protein
MRAVIEQKFPRALSTRRNERRQWQKARGLPDGTQGFREPIAAAEVGRGEGAGIARRDKTAQRFRRQQWQIYRHDKPRVVRVLREGGNNSRSRPCIFETVDDLRKLTPQGIVDLIWPDGYESFFADLTQQAYGAAELRFAADDEAGLIRLHALAKPA